MRRLRDMLSDQPNLTEVESHLDSLDPDRRVEEVRSLGRRHQACLFEAVQGYRSVSLDDIVPPSRGVMNEVVHLGKNSLPTFNYFAKVFVRPSAGPQEELWGYNRAGGFVETVVGPGYFVAYPHEIRGEVLVDYLRLPPERPAHWPEIIPNSARLSRFVYGGTQDILRGVSKDVTIGRATKAGKPISAWFILCRQEES